MFLDFEDWRLGTRGLTWTGALSPTAALGVIHAPEQGNMIPGALFWPFQQVSLGPDIPCYRTERNQGLVLDRSLQHTQLIAQQALVSDLQGRVDWLEKHIEDAVMGPELRSRKDVRENLTWVRADYMHWLKNEEHELYQLNSSMCATQSCTITFNTSSLILSGAINAKGENNYY